MDQGPVTDKNSVLLGYLSRQLDHFFPDECVDTRDRLALDVDEALDRLMICIDRVRIWRGTGFHHLHSEKNTIFLYYLANTIWRNRQDTTVCEKLFYLNKALNGFHCFYNTELPDVFFVGHSVGIVLVRTKYSRYLVLYQGVTVGKNHGKAPMLDEGVVLYPGSAVIGDCLIRSRSYIAQNTSVIDRSTPGDCSVFQNGRDIECRSPGHDILADFFHFD
jgi:serine O-acetyltransferase